MLSSFFFFLNNIHKSNIPQSRLALGHEMENLCYKTHLLLLKAERCAGEIGTVWQHFKHRGDKIYLAGIQYKTKIEHQCYSAILKQTTLIRCFEVKPIFSSAFSWIIDPLSSLNGMAGSCSKWTSGYNIYIIKYALHLAIKHVCV